MKYRVGIIGAGRIAAGFDTPQADVVLTHAHAVHNEPRFTLAGFWDSDPNASAAAARKWGGGSFGSLDELQSASPDLVIVAVPDEAHEHYLRRIADRAPKLVICEKPLTHEIDGARAIAHLYAKRKIPLLVNFQRRFDPVVIELQRRFKSGELGRMLGGTVWYSKGTKHNGSHAVDLLRFLFGEPKQLHAYAGTMDFRPDDLTVFGRMDFDAFSVVLLAADERLFSIFEIDLIFERARYRFSHSGLDVEVFEPQQDPVFQGYTELARVRSSSTGLSSSLGNLMKAAADYLDGAALPSNTAEDAVKTQEVCMRLINLAQALR